MALTLSAILYAPRGLSSVVAALDAWRAQTARERVELVVICPPLPPDEPVPTDVQIIDATELALHTARSLGIRAARGELVMLAEDHCLPDPDAAERFLARAEEGWDLVGPSLRSADPRKLASRAAFVLGYSEWMSPLVAGPTTVLPGHNSVIRRELLIALGNRLEEELRGSAFVATRLLRSGASGFVDPAIRMRHFDRPSWCFQFPLFACVGLGFGAIRTRDWPLLARLLYPLAIPAIVARHFWRAHAQLRRAEGFPPSRAGVAALALAWGLGEGVGALLGPARTTSAIELTEVKPISSDDVARSDRYECEQI
ncbi:MAG: glycosyltransferase [Gaiellales bacterium]